jgi:hypothetical protein
MNTFRKYWMHGLAVAALLVVFGFYTRPDFLVTLANQLWSCF